MRIPCPYCGERDAHEFQHLGDAGPSRPDPAQEDAAARFYAYVYLRDNPAGPHREFWRHAGGCGSWLIVERDTRTHHILGASLAQGAAP